MATDDKHELNRLFADIKHAASLINVPVQEDVVWDILTAYETWFASDDFVAFRVTSKDEQELSFRYLSLKPQDAYALAVEQGFLTPNGHPVYAVLPELVALKPDGGAGIDVGASHGLEKIWTVYTEPMSIEDVCALETLPPGIRQNLDLYKHYGLDWVSVIGVDYPSQTANIYWMGDSIPHDPAVVADLIRDFGFEVPSEEEVALDARAFTIYPTWTWDSDEMQRLSFGIGGPQDHVPTYWPEPIPQFAAQVPLQSELRLFTFNTCYALGQPGYYKLEADYRAAMPNMAPPVMIGIATAMQSVG